MPRLAQTDCKTPDFIHKYHRPNLRFPMPRSAETCGRQNRQGHRASQQIYFDLSFSSEGGAGNGSARAMIASAASSSGRRAGAFSHRPRDQPAGPVDDECDFGSAGLPPCFNWEKPVAVNVRRHPRLPGFDAVALRFSLGIRGKGREAIRGGRQAKGISSASMPILIAIRLIARLCCSYGVRAGCGQFEGLEGPA